MQRGESDIETEKIWRFAVYRSSYDRVADTGFIDVSAGSAE